jgi:prophage regulatory protein
LTRTTSTADNDVIPQNENMTNQEGGRGVETEIVGALDLEKLTGTKASTWRYWASIGTGPASFKLGRRRVWRKSAVLAWLAEQEIATAAGENA